ncbi:MAG: hypothetical protein ACPGJV_05310 [Bacteriovoracaceae bacterium]
MIQKYHEEEEFTQGLLSNIDLNDSEFIDCAFKKIDFTNLSFESSKFIEEGFDLEKSVVLAESIVKPPKYNPNLLEELDRAVEENDRTSIELKSYFKDTFMIDLDQKS